PVARRSLQKRLEGILEKFKPDREGLVHIFRHTKASQLVAAGADWQMVRQQLGWASLEMAKRYVHTDEEKISKVLERIG
ncbi:MAG: tyrosine-type recombinase/integrase, partial [Vicinamibacteria bacterium]